MAGREEQDSEQVLTVGGGDLPSAGQSPEVPAAAAAIASGPRFGDIEPSTGFVDERKEAAREAAEKRPRPKVRDLLNEAVGAEMYGINWTASRWRIPRTGQLFEVARYYMHKKVAIDFPDERQMTEEVPIKRAVLRSLGVVYIAVGPNDVTTKQQMMDAIEAERVLLQKGE